MPLTPRRKHRIRSQQRVMEVRPSRYFLPTFATGALIGWILAFIFFVYIPLFERHGQARRLISRDDPYTLLLANTSSDPWGDLDSGADERPKRVFCLILTVKHKHRLDQVRAMNETWVSDCDGLMFITDRRLPKNYRSFVPTLDAGGKPFNAARSRFGALKLALSRAPFSGEKFDFYLLTPDSVFVAMCNLRLLVSRVPADRPLAWGLLTQSYIPGEGRVAHLAGQAGVLLSDAARRGVAYSDCSWPRQPADQQLSLCLHRLRIPRRHVSGFHPTAASDCAVPPPPPPPRGLVQRMKRWARGQFGTQHWRPCPPRALTFGNMSFAAMRRAYYLMNLGVHGRTGRIDRRPYG